MTSAPEPESIRDSLLRGGETGADLLAVDWEATPLGPADAWPRSLSTIVRVLLTSRFPMWMAWGPELTFLCNDAYRRDTLGQKYPWALGRPAHEVWAEIWTEIGPRIDTVLRTGEATWDEALLLLLERSGFREETYHTFSYSPLADDDGRITGMLCVVTEDTRRVINERRMATLREMGSVSSGVREEHDFLAAASAAMIGNPLSLPFSAVYLFDHDGNARLATTTGIERGHPAAPTKIWASDPDPVWPLEQMAAGQNVIVDMTGSRFGRLPSGGWEDPPVRALALDIPQIGHATPYGFLVVGLNPYSVLDSEYRAFVDLIAQHMSSGIAAARTYEAERQRAQELEELDRAKTAFFSNVSHEFRTPLTLMLGPLQDALGAQEGLGSEPLELVHRNALRLLKLVNTLLDFSRAEAGRMQAEFRPTDICRLTSQLASTFQDATDRAGIELIVRCENPAEEVYLDRDLWERIVLNLVSNAFKATLAGSITVEVTPQPGAVELSVTDTGTGIPEDEITRLFARFHRARGETRSYEGTGIGLALVKELTELHGGKVGVSSKLGEGSRFNVRIPTGCEHLPREHVRDESLEPAASISALFVEEALSWLTAAGSDQPDEFAPSRELTAAGIGPDDEADGEQRPRVLIADDNQDLRRYLSSLLSSQFEVVTVSDGQEALASVRSRLPDLLISDVMMPGLDGYALLKRLRADPETRDLPVMLLSARAGEGAAIEGLAAGADDYLAKPFSGRELLARVRAHIELAQLRRQAAADVRGERSRLEQIIQQLPAGVLLAEAPSGRIVMGNEHAAEVFEHPIYDADVVSPDTPYRMLDHATHEPIAANRRPLVRAVRDGAVTEDEDFMYVTGSGRRITIRINSAPIRDDAGKIIAGVSVFQDVSVRVRSERLLSAQRDILRLIAEGEPLERALESMAHCVEALSEFNAKSAVVLVTPDGRHLRFGASPSLPVSYQALVDGTEIGPSAGTVGTAIFRGETVVIRDTTADPLWAGARELAGSGLRAAWATPIRADDAEIVGAFAVYYNEPREPDAEDRRVVDLLAGTAGVAIGRARDAQRQARRLAELQSSLLPRELPEVPGIDTAVSFRPADRGLEVGGDFYDLFALSDDRWGLVIGDVCGHGAEAAAVTALARHTTRAVARMNLSPSRVLEEVNAELMGSDHNRFCTALYGRLERLGEGICVRLAGGGHPAPLIRRVSGEIETLRSHGPLLGVFSDAQFSEVTAQLGAGDTLVLYTDGLVERNPRVQGDAGLRALLSSLTEVDGAAELMEELERRAVGAPSERLPDDAAIVVVQVTGTRVPGREAARAAV
jgi:signal transduction histidine kinase/serine phosphatase RsbU (regulator of sigma subunit)/FixJ family two-component response regulator